MQGLGTLGNRRGTDERRKEGCQGKQGAGSLRDGRTQAAHTCLPSPSLCSFLHHSHHLPVPHMMDGIDFASYLLPSKDSQLLKEWESFSSVHCRTPRAQNKDTLGASMAWWGQGR